MQSNDYRKRYLIRDAADPQAISFSHYFPYKLIAPERGYTGHFLSRSFSLAASSLFMCAHLPDSLCVCTTATDTHPHPHTHSHTHTQTHSQLFALLHLYFRILPLSFFLSLVFLLST